MSSYQELLNQLKELEAEIQKARTRELNEAIQKAKQIVQAFNLTAEDVFGNHKETKKVEPKYRDPETNQTWTGRGRQPLWIATAPDPSVYLIQKP